MRIKTAFCLGLVLAGSLAATEAQAGHRQRVTPASGPLWPYLLNFGLQYLTNNANQTNQQQSTTIPPAATDPVQRQEITDIQNKLLTIEKNLNITSPVPPAPTPQSIPQAEIVVPGPAPARPGTTPIPNTDPFPQ